MKTKKAKIIFSAFILSAVLSVSAVVTAVYNSEDDPLITLSYLTNVLVPQIKSEILQSLGSENTTTGNGENNNTPTTGGEVKSPASIAYQVVELTYGKKILAKNSLELILRPGGSAAVIAPLETQGISDLTNGIELYGGVAVPQNHACLVPRGDGRGIVITSDKAYVMVRGEYEIG